MRAPKHPKRAWVVGPASAGQGGRLKSAPQAVATRAPGDPHPPLRGPLFRSRERVGVRAEAPRAYR
jgi:hypothetical protein